MVLPSARSEELYPIRNYYPDKKLEADGLKFRLGADDIIISILEQLRGAVFDKYGRVVEYDKQYRLMNDQGIHGISFILKGRLTKITHLTKYDNKDEIARQIKPMAKILAFELVLNRKQWGVKDKDLIQQVIENTLYESMKRAGGGFENDNISKNWQVSQFIDQTRPGKEPDMGGNRIW